MMLCKADFEDLFPEIFPPAVTGAAQPVAPERTMPPAAATVLNLPGAAAARRAAGLQPQTGKAATLGGPGGQRIA